MSKTVKMSATSQDRVTLNIDRFPHLKKLIKAAEKLGTYIALMEEKKTILLSQQSKNKNIPRTLEVVNLDIEVIDLEIKIAKAHANKHERHEEINAYHNEVAHYLPIMEKEYSDVRKQALLMAQDQSFVDLVRLKEEIEIGNNNSKNFNQNWEQKMRHYLELKKILEPKPKPEAEQK